MGSVPDRLAPLLWACGKAAPHGGEHVVEQSCSLWDQDVKKGQKKDQSPTVPLEGKPPMT
jgi:hypothetical protein